MTSDRLFVARQAAQDEITNAVLSGEIPDSSVVLAAALPSLERHIREKLYDAVIGIEAALKKEGVAVSANDSQLIKLCADVVIGKFAETKEKQ